MKEQQKPVVLEPIVIDHKTLKKIIMKVKNYIKAILLGLMMVLGVQGLQAQQIPLFSSYSINPFLLSPSFAGDLKVDGQEATRLLLAHRSQFAGIDGAPITYNISLDAPIRSKNMGLGGTLYTDRYGLVRQTGFSLGYAYRIDLGKANLNFGLGGDVGQQSLDFTNINAFDMTDNLLNLQSGSKVYFNGMAGIHLSTERLVLGVTSNRLYGSRLLYKNYTSNNEFEYDLASHVAAFGSYRFTVKDSVLDLTPMLTVRGANGIKTQYDVMLKANIKESVFAVVGLRSDYAVSFGAGVTLNNNLTLSYIYDLMINDASPFAGGGHEITLGYTFLKGGSNARPICCDEILNNQNNELSERRMKEMFNIQVDSLRRKMNNLEDDNSKSKSKMLAMQREIDSLRNLKPKVIEKVIEKVTIKDNFIVNNIEFETGSAKIRSSSFTELDEIAEYLIAHPDKKLEISGHTDNVGQADANLLLSQKRAKSVATYFMSKGVSSSKLSHEGYGQTKPKESNDTAQGKQRNRRVELKLAE